MVLSEGAHRKTIIITTVIKIIIGRLTI